MTRGVSVRTISDGSVFIFLIQVFSKSVARGLRYYKTLEDKLKDSESTAQFCETFDRMFDALNRTSFETAIRPNCNDIRVLEDSLMWLNSWKERVNQGLIAPEEFLTNDADVGLRMTLRSTLDLIKYLI
ncbi:uncharacterized protein LOC127278682 [Leptopilina boulardi]|uniref:uncharacterized protein LOC127278682 n=1 Tax=Leptopilina boulardi TaxID=63433 RepID=UPI0021F5231F|nr:uncharacterized protein LOC127278682 [Leptopilina boulardi]